MQLVAAAGRRGRTRAAEHEECREHQCDVASLRDPLLPEQNRKTDHCGAQQHQRCALHRAIAVAAFPHRREQYVIWEARFLI